MAGRGGPGHTEPTQKHTRINCTLYNVRTVHVRWKWQCRHDSTCKCWRMRIGTIKPLWKTGTALTLRLEYVLYMDSSTLKCPPTHTLRAPFFNSMVLISDRPYFGLPTTKKKTFFFPPTLLKWPFKKKKKGQLILMASAKKSPEHLRFRTLKTEQRRSVQCVCT